VVSRFGVSKFALSHFFGYIGLYNSLYHSLARAVVKAPKFIHSESPKYYSLKARSPCINERCVLTFL